MAPTFRSSSSAVVSGSTLTFTNPAGMVAGDVILAFFALAVGGVLPSDWNLVARTDPGGPGPGGVAWRFATASDITAATITLAGANSYISTLGTNIVSAYSGAGGIGNFATVSWLAGPAITVPSIVTQDYNSRVSVQALMLNNHQFISHPGFTQRNSFLNTYGCYSDDKEFKPRGATGTSVLTMSDEKTGGWLAVVEILPTPMQANLQAVFTMIADGQRYRGITAEAQVVATLTADAGRKAGGEAHLQVTSRLAAEATGTRSLDFTVFDAYIETQNDFFGLLFYDDPYQGAQTFGPLSRSNPLTRSRALQPVRQDVGFNPAEIRPEFGDIFAQNDFSHGSGQTYFHELGRDPKRYFTSEGYDISEPGRLTHLHKLAPAIEDNTTGPMTQAAGLPFVGIGTVVRRGDGNLPGTWTDEDPAPGGGAHTVLSLAAEGARLFAALGTTGVHMRNSAGVWVHYQPDGATNLDIDPATVVAWVKDRLMVIGGTDGRSIYEVVADSTPSPIDTLKEGWEFVSIGEAGGFIEACAVNLDAGQSVIYSYGLNDAATAIEKKSQTAMPIGQLAYVVSGYIGTALIGGGRVNDSGGYDPFLYRAQVNALGELDYTLIRQEKGSGAADLSVREITPIGQSVLLSWTLGSSAAFGEARDGIAIYDLARDSFARHLRREGAGGANQVRSILPYKGHILLAIESFGLYYEDLTAYVDDAVLVTSLADWNNAGNKVWDQIELSHDALPAGTSVTVDYTTKPQSAGEWNAALISQITGAEGAVSRLSTTTSRVFALRISSFASPTAYPVVQSFAVRSHPSPERPEWDLVRFVRLLNEDRKDEQGTSINQKPRELMAALRRAVNTWVTFYESGTVWTAFLTDVVAVESAQPFYAQRAGDPLKDEFVVELSMTGTEG